MTDDLTTKPTLDTLLTMMRELRDGMAQMEERLAKTLEERLAKTLEERLAGTLEERLAKTLEERLAMTLEERLTKVVDERLAKFEERLNVRLDRIEAEVKQTHSELFTLRADFTELRSQLREHLPALK
jgi:predicted metal-dependent hydrolase